MKIVVVGLGYVGLSNAVLLAQHNEVIGVDISQERVDALNARKSPIIDSELSDYLAGKDLNLSASTDLKASLSGADYVIVSTPTNYDEKTNFFDTSSVERVIVQVIKNEPNACIVVKSTIPVGFIDRVREQLEIDAAIFSPEFLREGKALYDNLYPSRIIVGEKSERAATFAKLLAQGAIKSDVDLLLTDAREAEAIKLFSNTYLAMRVAFFNELDSYALTQKMNSRDIISGVSLDPRIGNWYNNPSFGYGGYCLPKDTKQLAANFIGTPQALIDAVIESNELRRNVLANAINKTDVNNIGVHRLAMKQGSDNSRQSAVLGLAVRLKQMGKEILIFEENLKSNQVEGLNVTSDLQYFKDFSDVIICNRMSNELEDVSQKVFTRDIFNED
jgi:UDPglucose 6-dehydrogenase